MLLRIVASVWAIVLGALASAVVLFLGPSESVVCGEASWPASAFGDMWERLRGHTDGAQGSFCSVPQGWVVLLAPVPVLISFGMVISVWIAGRRD